MLSNIITKEATLSDVNSLAVLFDHYRIFYEKESDLNAAVSFLTERIKSQESVIFIAALSEMIVGFVQLYPIFSSTHMKRLWLLNDLYVVTEQRGKGISVLLINAAKTLAEKTNASGLLLETAIDNKVANSLYKKTGFELDSSHNYYFWNNQK